MRQGPVKRFFLAVLAALLVASMFAPPMARPAQAAVNDEGRAIEVFYERNIVALEGYPADTPVTIEVVRGAEVVGSVTRSTDATGFLEINHVGDGDCWTSASTPDIKPGDKVQTTVLNADGSPRPDASGAGADVDFTMVRDVFVDLDAIAFDDVNGTITVKGHVKSTEAAPIVPGQDVLEFRMNKANRDNPWGDNGDPSSRRDLRADIGADLQADGSFTHVFGDDPATPENESLTPEDVVDARENGVDQALLWLPGPIDEARVTPEATFFDASEGVPPGCPPLEGSAPDQDAFKDHVPNVHKAQQLTAEAREGVDSPRSIEVFHGIEFVGLVNYPARTDVRVDVLRDGVVIGSTTQKTDASGLMEINHLGGGLFPAGDCWDPGNTPDIKPGDRVLSTILSNGEQDSTAVRDIMLYEDQTRVDTTNDTITLKGHARSTADAPMNLGGINPDVLELRMNANGFTWQVNNLRKDLRADIAAEPIYSRDFNDGDNDPTTYTHVFQVSNQDADNAARAGFEQMIEWSPPAAEPNLPPELTVFDGVAGANPGCPPMLANDAITSSSQPIVNAGNEAQNLVLSGVASGNADSIAISIEQNGAQIVKQAAQPAANGKTWTATFAASELADLQEGRFDAEATFVRSAGEGVPAYVTFDSAAMKKDITAPANPTATPEPGSYTQSQQVELKAEQDARVYYTTDGSDPRTSPSRTLYSSPIAVNANATIQAVAVDRAGNTSGVATFAYTIQAAETQLSLNASPNSFTFGEAGSVTLSGNLASGANGLANQQVVLEKQPAGATNWGRVTTGTSGADGNFSFNVAKSSVDRNTDFRVRFAGTEGYKASQAAQSVQVKVGVTLNQSTASFRLGQTVTLSGAVSPAHSGTVRLTIDRPGTLADQVQNVTLNRSSYSFKYKPTVRGDYTVVAHFAGDADHAAGQSAPRTFRAT
jgi:hypothetical protein